MTTVNTEDVEDMSYKESCKCLPNEGCDICDPEGTERLKQRNNGRPQSQGAIGGNKKRGRYGRIVVNRDGHDAS